MILAMNNMDIPKEWHHDSLIHNNNNITVAIYLLNNNIIPSKEWCYDL